MVEGKPESDNSSKLAFGVLLVGNPPMNYLLMHGVVVIQRGRGVATVAPSSLLPLSCLSPPRMPPPRDRGSSEDRKEQFRIHSHLLPTYHPNKSLCKRLRQSRALLLAFIPNEGTPNSFLFCFLPVPGRFRWWWVRGVPSFLPYRVPAFHHDASS